MKIESASSEDCRGIAEVHVESWQHAYKGILREENLASLSVTEHEAMWRRRVQEQQPSHLLVARDAGQVVGFVAFGKSREDDAHEDQAEIWAIYVRPPFWSTGAGRSLWLAASQQICAKGFNVVILWVLASNARAMRFYERAGFVADAQSRRQLEIGGSMLEGVRYVLAYAG